MITSHLLLTLVLAGQVTQVAPESLGIPGERPGRSWVEEAEAESSPSDVLPWITRPVDPTEFTRLPPIDGASEPIDWLGERPQQLTVWQQISSDYRNFYS
ncbi:MAG: hypothetical protein ACKPEY_06970, partial [Planctomycetota bacterium]